MDEWMAGDSWDICGIETFCYTYVRIGLTTVLESHFEDVTYPLFSPWWPVAWP